ncbi:hypothetical protein [Hathewaya massiliensis]|nr:hypothetical protein [Hathewaya massiliensis]
MGNIKVMAIPYKTFKERIRLTNEYLDAYHIENMNGFLYLQKKEVLNSEK